MSQIIERLNIAVWAIGRNITNRFRKQPQNKRVLLIFQQIFGDSVILLSALQGYVDLYCKKKGYEITLLCLPSIAKFWKETASLPQEVRIIPIDFKKLVNNFSYFKEISNKYHKFAEITIVPGSSMSADLLSSTLCSKERYGLISCYKLTWPLQMALFQRLGYTDVVQPPVGSMMIQRHRIMLNHLGLCDYKGHLSSLLVKNAIIEGRYCVICPGASTPIKRWPSDRFSRIADWIIENYNMDVHLCGGALEKRILKS